MNFGLKFCKSIFPLIAANSHIVSFKQFQGKQVEFYAPNLLCWRTNKQTNNYSSLYEYLLCFTISYVLQPPSMLLNLWVMSPSWTYADVALVYSCLFVQKTLFPGTPSPLSLWGSVQHLCAILYQNIILPFFIILIYPCPLCACACICDDFNDALKSFMLKVIEEKVGRALTASILRWCN